MDVPLKREKVGEIRVREWISAARSFFQAHFKKRSGNRPKQEDQGPDLFEYARRQSASADGNRGPAASVPEAGDEDRDEERAKNRKRSRLLALLLLLMLLLPLMFYLGTLFGREEGCRVGRSGIVYGPGEAQQKARLDHISDGRLFFSLEGAGEPGDLALADISRIDFLPDPGKAKEPEMEHQPTEAERRFLGSYRVNISGHQGDLWIYTTKTGYTGATLRFATWGRRAPEYLKGVRIEGNRIQFVRSCSGAECARIGSPAPFRQIYSGEMDMDGRLIEGNYTGGQNASGWKAYR